MSSPHGGARYEPFAGFDSVGGGSGRPPAPDARTVGLRAWIRDLALGARFAAGGGREGWTRTALTAVGVGLGVALLLLTAAVPAMMHTRDQKRVAREPSSAAYIAHPGASTLLSEETGTTYHGDGITGLLVHPEGPKAQLPPGVTAWPGTGRMVVSPALERLLASSPLLRERIPYPITGTIGHAGLMGPAELYYYAGSDQLVARDSTYHHGNADRIAGFGAHSNSAVMGPTFDLLLIVVLVVLLLPVAVFIGTAVRLGGERRDRRLAALRLVGADIRTTHRIAAGEALLGAVFGLLVGALLFLVGRQLASHVTIRDISAYPGDMAPNPALTVLIVLAVPIASIAVTLAGLRGTTIEPLGVVRQGVGRRRRLWWRLLLPAAGLALLAPLFGKVKGDVSLNEYQVAAGAVLLLFGVTAVLPWVVEAAVGRLRGGPVVWQLATRRLQLNSSSSARMVSGVTVAVAGAIALQMLFHGVDGDFVSSTGADTSRAQAVVNGEVGDSAQVASYVRSIAAAKGVSQVYGFARADATRPDASTLKRDETTDYPYLPVDVAGCPTLRQLARITSCAPGSVFLVPPDDDPYVHGDYVKFVRPGGLVDLNSPDSGAYHGKARLWRIPAGAVTAHPLPQPSGAQEWGVLATPEALGKAALSTPQAQITVSVDPKQPDAIERVRNAVAAFGPAVRMYTLHDTKEKSNYIQLRRGLYAGATLTMGLIGASLLVTMLEQLRERRKLLAVLVAFGTRRSALAWSVLWQTAVPVVLGLVLACAGGIGLGAALLAMVGGPFHVDWAGMGAMSGIGAGVVLLVTLLSLPPLWRLMRADGLRTE
ncbi:FtsX-like permease family protein [Actinacidiphila yanglinensis]|uniref:FtsX-like permease family protein n=1 Tax=Actinacidiphila yanglinensis TaxID=310779 RepID=A0A1H5UYU4_9ACTN|nr:ABC transporter permease [Actinacidiphila yanglinensis]SEF80176.1 FtsX-like permease family protein [Actinacidiphila yanglinensis]